jgi:hypothetical protein
VRESGREPRPHSTTGSLGGVIRGRGVSWIAAHREQRDRTWLGPGFAPPTSPPEVTLAVIERQAPGIAEAMRRASRDHTRHWMLSRGVAGIRGLDPDRQLPGQPPGALSNPARRSPRQSPTRWS